MEKTVDTGRSSGSGKGRNLELWWKGLSETGMAGGKESWWQLNSEC